MDKKYELLKDDCINYEGRTLYRIKALRDFGYIKKGKLGGYIQSENNLSHEGECWVYGNAKVYEDARVFGNAKVFMNARVYGNAKVFGEAEVYDNAEVYGNSKIFENAEVYVNAVINKGRIIGRVSMPYKDIFQYQCENRVLTAILTEDDEILYSIGCQENITEEEFIYRIHNKDGGLKENPHRAEYLKLIKIIKLYLQIEENVKIQECE